MSNVPAQWDRWFYASCAKHFYDRRQSIFFHVEGQKRETQGESEWLEFRMDGPYYDLQTENSWEAHVEINIGVVTIETTDGYRIHTLSGIAVAAFTSHIQLLKLGDPADDPANDGSEFGCLTFLPGKKEKVVKSFFGKIRTDVEMYQASVEGHYRAFLTGDV